LLGQGPLSTIFFRGSYFRGSLPILAWRFPFLPLSARSCFFFRGNRLNSSLPFCRKTSFFFAADRTFGLVTPPPRAHHPSPPSQAFSPQLRRVFPLDELALRFPPGGPAGRQKPRILLSEQARRLLFRAPASCPGPQYKWPFSPFPPLSHPVNFPSTGPEFPATCRTKHSLLPNRPVRQLINDILDLYTLAGRICPPPPLFLHA